MNPMTWFWCGVGVGVIVGALLVIALTNLQVIQ